MTLEDALPLLSGPAREVATDLIAALAALPPKVREHLRSTIVCDPVQGTFTYTGDRKWDVQRRPVAPRPEKSRTS